MTATLLLAASAAIILALGLAHLVFTYHGPKLRPRDTSLQTGMARVSPVISRETTMWRAWVGFNASHSLGAILFGLVYGYLALIHRPFLLASPFLPAIGLLFLGGLTIVARRYWFSVPFTGIVAALLCFTAGLIASRP
jgi:hypothetical protein